MEKEKKESGADMSEKGFEAERMFLAVKIAKRKGDAGSILALEREIRENPAYEEYFRKSGEKIVFDKEFLTDDSMVNIVDFVRYVSKEDIQQKCKNEEYKKKFISDFKQLISDEIEEEDSEEWYTMDKIIKEEILSLPELQEIITPLYVDKKISLAAELGSKEHEEIEKKLIQYFDSTGLIDPQQEREIFRNMYRKYLEDSFVDEVINGNIDLKYIHAFPLDVRNELEKEFE